MNTTIDPIAVATEIYIRACVNVMNGRGKPWALKDKEHEQLATEALEAGRAFATQANAPHNAAQTQ